MNRAERRQHLRDMKRDGTLNKMATQCLTCKGKTLHISIPTKDHLCDIVCEHCGTTVARNIEGCIPYTYVRWEGE